MKKSEQYGVAMCTVIENGRISTLEKLEILETLMAEKRMAEMLEEREEAESE
jgi:hypothetical protein